jgi:hypothetical protein
MSLLLNAKKKVYDFTLVQDKTPEIFTVGPHSMVVFLEPITGETLTEADSFELRRVIAITSTRSIKQFHLDKTAILLGATLPQFEVVAAGDYILDKILDTTESTAAFIIKGAIKGT